MVLEDSNLHDSGDMNAAHMITVRNSFVNIDGYKYNLKINRKQKMARNLFAEILDMLKNAR